MAHFLTIVAGRPGGWISFAGGLQQLHELVFEGIVPGADGSVVAVVLVPVGPFARGESIESLLLFSVHGGVSDFDDLGSG